jgi:hypothetical protein
MVASTVVASIVMIAAAAVLGLVASSTFLTGAFLVCYGVIISPVTAVKRFFN